MCNSNKQESYVDIEIVNLLNKLYKDKDKVSDEQIRTFVALMQANITIEWKGMNLESLKGQLSSKDKEYLRINIYKDYLKRKKKWKI